MYVNHVTYVQLQVYIRLYVCVYVCIYQLHTYSLEKMQHLGVSLNRIIQRPVAISKVQDWSTHDLHR
jgi:hypothetical protein